MATENIPTLYEFDVEAIPVPPGTKTQARLPRGDEAAAIPTRAWWMAGAIAIAALVVGVLIGRFVL